MTDERIMAAFGRLDLPVEPEPIFAEQLFATLADGMEWGSMPDPSLRGRIRRALGLGTMPTGRQALRLARIATVAAALLALLGLALYAASRLHAPTPAELVQLSQQTYEHPPAFSVSYDMPMGGGVTLSSDGAGTWRVEMVDEGAGAYWLWDGADRVGHFDPTTGSWATGIPEELNMIGPPTPLWAEYTWGTGEMYRDDPFRHVIPCRGATVVPDGRVILGRPTDHVICTDIDMQYWLDRETRLILRMEGGPSTPHWSGTPGVTSVVEAYAFSVGPQPASAFDWNGPEGISPSPSPSVAPSPSMPVIPAGIASDQPCLSELADPTAVADVGFAPHELEALLLDGTALGVTEGGWSRDPWSSSYLDDIEVAAFASRPEDTCAVLERLGRVTGYSLTYGDETSNDQLTESVDLFLDPDGAAAYVPWVAATLSDSAAGVTSQPVDAGDGGLAISASGPDGDRTTIVFRSGVLVGTLSFQGQTGHAPPVPLSELVGPLAARIEAAKPSGRPYDLAHLMSAAVPRADLPSPFAPLGWDLTFGGCWDHRELTGTSADPEAIAKDIATFGHEIYCLGMYSPSGDCGPGWCPSPRPSASPPTGIIRVATGINVLASPSAAQGWLASAMARYEATAVETELERFDVPGIPGAIGLRRHVQDGDVAEIDTRVMFVHGDISAVAYVHDRTETDHRADVIAMAKALDARLALVLGPGHAPTSTPTASSVASPSR